MDIIYPCVYMWEIDVFEKMFKIILTYTNMLVLKTLILQ